MNAITRRGRLPTTMIALGVLLLGVAATLLAVSSRGGDEGPCGREIREPLDPRSLQHVLPGTPPPTFATAAPSSGPHQAGAETGGVRSEPLSPAVQVGALESGSVVLQHRRDVVGADLAALQSLAGARVIVAPNPRLEAPVIATAWQVRLRCSAVDVDRLRRFVQAHAGHPPTASHVP